MFALGAQQYSKESIQQLVMEAETLVREEILMKTPTRGRHSFSGPSGGGTRRKTAVAVEFAEKGTHPKIKRVQEWLQHQPSTSTVAEVVGVRAATTDCEASGEYTGKRILYIVLFYFQNNLIYILLRIGFGQP